MSLADGIAWEREYGIAGDKPSAVSAGYRRDLWQVDISLGGESILTLSHNHLGGIEDISDYEDVVEKCAEHLLAFIGKSR